MHRGGNRAAHGVSDYLKDTFWKQFTTGYCWTYSKGVVFQTISKIHFESNSQLLYTPGLSAYGCFRLSQRYILNRAYCASSAQPKQFTTPQGQNTQIVKVFQTISKIHFEPSVLCEFGVAKAIHNQTVMGTLYQNPFLNSWNDVNPILFYLSLFCLWDVKRSLLFVLYHDSSFKRITIKQIAHTAIDTTVTGMKSVMTKRTMRTMPCGVICMVLRVIYVKLRKCVLRNYLGFMLL